LALGAWRLALGGDLRPEAWGLRRARHEHVARDSARASFCVYVLRPPFSLLAVCLVFVFGVSAGGGPPASVWPV
jgi:hypothetical protein